MNYATIVQVSQRRVQTIYCMRVMQRDRIGSLVLGWQECRDCLSSITIKSQIPPYVLEILNDGGSCTLPNGWLALHLLRLQHKGWKAITLWDNHTISSISTFGLGIHFGEALTFVKADSLPSHTVPFNAHENSTLHTHSNQ